MTREDKRQDYGAEHLVWFGLHKADVVVMVYSERSNGAHVISPQKAEKHEACYYRQVVKIQDVAESEKYVQQVQG